MHELFLSDLIPKANMELVMKILQGYCSMSPVHFIRRVQMWEGPRNRNALKNLDPNLITKQIADKVRRWRMLNETLFRQAYYVSLLYEVEKSEFGKAEGKDESEILAIDFDKLSGTLRWSDIPDPTSDKQKTNGRAIVEISDERGLHTILKSINYRFVREFIKDGYRFVHENVLFELFRMITLHPQGEISNLGNPLPPLNSLTLFDSEDKWCLRASIKVDDGVERTEAGQKLSQKLRQEATNQLLAIKNALDGSEINLHIEDRLLFDTRVKN